MFTKKNLINLLGAGLLLLAGIFLFQECSKRKTVSKHQDNRLSILQVDSIKYAAKMERRRALDSMGVLLDDALSNVDTVYTRVTKYDTKIEIRYRDRPTLELCDSVIDSKNKRIGLLVQRDSLHGELVKIKNSAIILQDSIIEDKHQTILSLSAGYKKATDDLDRLGRKRVVISVGAGYGVGADLKPQPFAGVTVGYKLFEL